MTLRTSSLDPLQELRRANPAPAGRLSEQPAAAGRGGHDLKWILTTPPSGTGNDGVPLRRPRRIGRRVVLAGAAGVVAACGIAAVGLVSSGGGGYSSVNAAYAVTASGDDVKVAVKSVSDPAGLQRSLRAAKVNATVIVRSRPGACALADPDGEMNPNAVVTFDARSVPAQLDITPSRLPQGMTLVMGLSAPTATQPAGAVLITIVVVSGAPPVCLAS